MKKVLALILSLTFLFTACAKKDDIAKEDEIIPPEVVDTTSEFYKVVADSNERPIAVMIDNDNSSAWPQAGLDKAYKVYEVMVEGGSTRFMALFKNTDCEKIGPVRSSRHYFLDYVLENDATYVHFGWSPKAANDISSLGINKINGILGTDESIFWRERKYAGDWHSAYTNIANIKEMASKKGYRNTTEDKIENINREFCEIEGESALNITVPYSYHYKVYYTYDAENKVYKRKMNSTEHKDANGVYATATNIIIQYTRNYSLGDGSDRQEVDTVGSGEGIFITGGKCVPVTWQKTSRNAKTVFKTADGNEVMTNPGTTWINVIHPNTPCVIE
ncbi:MAG: DUF3048 domain-containing protein [Ruminococcaceae bacterium]|nr:DUF3048 domain-containing protein [Oscillospiraceae bacterium]